MNFSFYKMHGLGNDFVIIDCRQRSINLCKHDVQLMANRRIGIGCDQVIIINRHNIYDCEMVIFNQDGSEAEACGNATRCVAYLLDKHKSTILSHGRVLRTEKTSATNVSVDMGIPAFKYNLIAIDESPTMLFNIEGFEQGIIVHIGNPHLVFFKDCIDMIDVKKIGSAFEKHEKFTEGINVSFAKILDKDNILLRVWERGAGETLACGTAACATFAAARLMRNVNNRVRIALPGGDLYCFENDSGSINMSGSVTFVFRGEYSA